MTTAAEPRGRRGLIAWGAILALLWLFLVLGCYWEPVVRDGWRAVRWHAWNDVTPSTLWTAIKTGYYTGNPRLGNIVTILQYTDGPWHVLLTPLMELAMFGLLATLVLGRRPLARSTDDALVFATVAAMVLACAPSIGQMLFYRPYSGNYVFGFVMQLALLVPYRIRGEGGPPIGRGVWWRVPVMLALGFVAGMCNEHTPPAVGAAAMVAVIACVRRGDRPRAGMLAWMIAGLVGLGVGWLVLITAPGQAFRYNALAEQATTLERIGDRGALGNAWVLVKTLWYLGWATPWIALGVVARQTAGAAAMSRARRLAIGVGLAAAVLAAITLLGSPKEGERLAFASCVLATTAIASWVTAQLAPGRSRLACVGLAALAYVVVAALCLSTLHEVSSEGDARLAAVRAAAPRSTLVVPPYTAGRSHWFIGDDFVLATTRQFVANTFNLAAIELAPGTTVTP